LFARHYPDFTPKAFHDFFKDEVQSDSELFPLYQSTAYTPLWMQDTLNTKNLHELTIILKNADRHGLPSDLFPVYRISLMLDSIDIGLYPADSLHHKILSLERLASKVAIRYIEGMNYGFVKPKQLFGEDYDIDLAEPDSLFWSDVYARLKENPIQAILNSHPTDSVYTYLQNEYKSLADKGFDLKKVNMEGTTYKLGNKSKHISEIAARLIQTGEYIPDPAKEDSLHMELDEELLDAVNRFRSKISYPEEKEVGQITIDALNRPFDYYKDKISANMERHRWRKIKTRHNKHIEVNVAASMLAATEPDSVPMIMRVCVGSVKNKTPLLESNLSYLNLNPVWNVPKSITRKEVVLLQKKDTSYIRRKNMKIFKGAEEIDPASIDWVETKANTFPYIIRQDPGEGNSLGLIKFIFNNAHAVYLHDTPMKSAFNRKNRAVSHGCVRVQKPFDLAFFCTNPSSEIYKDQLLHSVKRYPISKEGRKLLKEDNLKKLPDTILIKSNNKISLAIDYYTAFMYPDDTTLYYADDIYDYDKIILDALRREL
jgi:murein L,D-transpeptidase YcbB/YkuD